MPARRTVSIPRPNCLLRTSLEQHTHPKVDSILKDLKQCTRQLQAALSSEQVELQVLEKLYYKGNNQHRTALFWQRVSDIRRFARRLDGMGLLELVEGIRLSFWGNDIQPKVLKGPWTHVPEPKTLRTVLNRLRDACILVDRMREHLTKAHSHLNLELQTGAFLQLILTLTAITSRMAILLTEISPTIELSWDACFRALELIDPSQAPLVSRIAHSPYSTRNEGTTTSRRASEAPPIPNDGEDLGVAVPQDLTRANSQVRTVDPVQAFIGEQNRVIIENPAPQIAQVLFKTSSNTTVVRKTIQREHYLSDSAEPVSNSSSTIVKRKDGSSHAAKSKKKKKKKKDEIDDIFGF